MRTEYLKYFLEVVKAGSFNKASQQLNVTHQTISTGITNLENELNTQLVIRDKQGITLTPAGKSAVDYAQTILEDISDFQQAMIQVSATPSCSTLSGHLTVLVSPLINSFIIPYIITPFLIKYPKLTLHFSELEGTDIMTSLQNNKGDLGLLALSSTFIDSQSLPASTQPIFNRTFRLYAVMSTNHPLAKRKSMSASTLIKYPLVLYQIGDSPGALQKFIVPYGEPNIYLVTDNLSVYKQCIVSGQAIGFLPMIANNRKFNLMNDLPNIVTVPIKEAPRTPIGYALSPNLSPAKQELCQLLINELLSLF